MPQNDLEVLRAMVAQADYMDRGWADALGFAVEEIEETQADARALWEALSELLIAWHIGGMDEHWRDCLTVAENEVHRLAPRYGPQVGEK